VALNRRAGIHLGKFMAEKSHYAYPRQLAEFVLARWPEVASAQTASGDSPAPLPFVMPEPDALEELFSVAYHASMLREEDRPVLFRLLLCDPQSLPAEAGPPEGLHRLPFDEPRPFEPNELRRLAPAANFYRALVGVWCDGRGELVIWGIVQTGPRWLQSVSGGRHHAPKPPPALVVKVRGPGYLEVSHGSVRIAKFEGGQISGAALNVFDSKWLSSAFESVRDEIMGLHRAARSRANAPWAIIDEEVIKLVAQNMIKRLIATVRNTRHGGTIIVVPPSVADEIIAKCCRIKLKYAFSGGEPRARYRTLIVAIMNRLAETYGAQYGSGRRICWNDYVASRDEQIEQLDEAVFEMANLIAALAGVDGAVVMTQRFELLGFAGEIAGSLEDVPRVERALDLEAGRCVTETTENVGTRHRSAYRLCQAIPDALAIVISQDGDVRFVKRLGGAVVYWNQGTVGMAES
jgi:hypothetical protein